MQEMGCHSVKMKKEWGILLQYQDLIKAFPFDWTQQELRYMNISLGAIYHNVVLDSYLVLRKKNSTKHDLCGSSFDVDQDVDA